MANQRLAIKTALFTLAQGATFDAPINGSTTWLETGRKLKLWNQIDPSRQPSMFMVQHKEQPHQQGLGLEADYLEMGLWCYATTGDAVVGDDLLDIMYIALRAALAPDDPSTNELTLGGLVEWARIQRTDNLFIRDPGDVDGQALLVLPIRILVP